MALDVYIQPKVELPRIGGDYELIVQFEDDGYFHFLRPLFEELKGKTSQNIDFYDDAAFGATHLDDLKETITTAKQLLVTRPKTWDVLTGTQIFPTQKEMYSTVHKQDLKKMLDTMESAVAKAKAIGSYITFWCD